MIVYSPSQRYRDYLQSALPSHIRVSDTPQEASVFVSGTLKGEDVHDQLKAVIIPFAGHNGIDLDAIESNNIALFNTQAHAVYVAEMALKLTLGIMGNVQFYHNELRHGRWAHRNSGARIPWVTLIGKNVGIYGYGAIGQHFARLIEPFNTTIHVIDRGKDYGACTTHSSLSSMVRASDVVLIAAPLKASTKHAFDDSILSAMDDTFLINVGRGAIVEQSALYSALVRGTLKGYAADVWYTYPTGSEPQDPSIHPLHTLDNVLLSPHFGGFNDQAQEKMRQQVLATITAIDQGDYTGALSIEKLKE